jgi:hypothetical protein
MLLHKRRIRNTGRLGHMVPLAALGLVLLLGLAGCAPGDERFVASPAGFWAGLWHGLILLVTFIISLFSDGVQVYEASNSGGLYDLGFLLGVAMFFGAGGHKSAPRRHKAKAARSAKEQEWAEIGEGMEAHIRTGIKAWMDEAAHDEKEWADTAAKLEKKILRELRKWADE